jgi:hypothetical protein
MTVSFTQLAFAAAELTAADPVKDAVLALIAGDIVHKRDRAAVVEAIAASVRPDGTTDANAWRPLIPPYVYPRVVGATVNALTKAGVLIPTGQWVISDDRKGRNSGRPMRVWRWNPTAVRHAR